MAMVGGGALGIAKGVANALSVSANAAKGLNVEDQVASAGR